MTLQKLDMQILSMQLNFFLNFDFFNSTTFSTALTLKGGKGATISTYICTDKIEI